MEAYKTPAVPAADEPGLPVPDHDIDSSDTAKDYPDLEPLDVLEARGIDPVLDSLGIEEPLDHIDGADRNKISDIGRYIKDVIDNRKLKPTFGNFEKVFDEIMGGMDMDDGVEPYAIIDRISGVVRGWRDLGFIEDSSQKRSLFMKLARMNSSKDMNKFIYDEMEKRKVWQ